MNYTTGNFIMTENTKKLFDHDNTQITFGGSLKSLGDNRIGGYLVRFTHPQKRDLHGDYFTRDTDFHLEDYPLENRPILFQHGMYKGTGIKPIGKITSHKIDDEGLWIEGILDEHNEYILSVRELMDKGVLGWSSGALPQSVKVDNGFIKSWAIIEGSATHTPAMPIETTIMSIKTLSESPQDGNDTRTITQSDTTRQGLKAMTPEEFKQLFMDLCAEMGLTGAQPEMEAAMRAENDKLDGEPVEDIIKACIKVGIAAHKKNKSAWDSALSNAFKSELVASAKGVSQIDTAMKSGAPSYIGDYALKRKVSQTSPEGLGFLLTVLQGQTGKMQLSDAVKSEALRVIADGVVSDYTKGNTRHTPSAVKSALAIHSMKADELVNTGQTGFGIEWVWENWQSQLWEKARAENRILSHTPSFAMEAKVDYYPLEGADPTVYYVAESTDATDMYAGNGTMSKIATAKTTFTARKLQLVTGWSAEEDEDSIIRYADNANRQSQRAFSDAIDSVLINGDTETGANTNINLINGTPTTGTNYLIVNGMLKYALVTNTANAVAYTTDLTTSIGLARNLLGREFMTDVDRMVIYCDPETYVLMTRQPEFLTFDVANTANTLRTGHVGWYLGIPVVSTPRMGKAYTDGKIRSSAGDNTKGRIAIVYTPYVMVGFRRQISSYVARAIDGEAYQLTLNARLDFQYNANADHVAVVYNIPL